MNRKSKYGIVCLLLIGLFLVCKGPEQIYAYEAKSESMFLWEENGNGTVTITGIENAGVRVEIPEQIEGKTVAAVIADAIVLSPSIEELVIPKTVTNFAGYPLYNDQSLYESLNLSSILVAEDNPVFTSQDGILYTKDRKKLLFVPNGIKGVLRIPETVETIVGKCGCGGITQLYIPDSVSEIYYDAFIGCASLESITVSEGNQEYISDDGLLFKKNWGEFCLMSVPGGRCGKEFWIPDITVTVTIYAFSNCVLLERVHIPAGVNMKGLTYYEEDQVVFQYEGSNWFLDCPALKEIIVDEENQTMTSLNGVLYSKDMTKLYAFPRNYEATEYEIPEGVTEISAEAFKYCSNLKSVTFPDTLQRIGRCAYERCNGLTEIILPDGVEQLDTAAFFYCQNLRRVVLPETMKTIHADVFTLCSSLITLDAGKYTEEIRKIRQSGESWSAVAEEPVSVLLQKKMSEMKYEADGFTYSITVDGELIITGLAEGAMRDGKGRTLVIPEVLDGKSVTGIADGAFAHVPLSSVTLPEGLIEIGGGAFYGCNLSGRITVPASVSYIGNRAFGANYMLEEVLVISGNKTYESVNGVLYNSERTMLVFMPANYQIISYYVPEGVQIIGDYAFGNNRNIVKLVLPDSLAKVENKALWNMLRLVALSIPKKELEMAEDAMEHCYRLKTPSYRNVD